MLGHTLQGNIIFADRQLLQSCLRGPPAAVLNTPAPTVDAVWSVTVSLVTPAWGTWSGDGRDSRSTGPGVSPQVCSRVQPLASHLAPWDCLSGTRASVFTIGRYYSL